MTYLRILFLIFSIGAALPINAIAQDTATYYVTKTGKKYHKVHCHYLKYSKYKIKTTDERFQFYTACKVCRPPVYENNTRSNQPTATPQARCTAITQAGTRCKRTAKKGQKTCWQHE